VDPEVYLPVNQGGNVPAFLWPEYLLVRTTGDPLALAGAVRQAVWSVDPDQGVSNMRSMDEIFDKELLNRHTQLALLGSFAILAFVMAAIGVYGVLAYGVAQRLPEIGIRLALGASRASIVVETLRSAMILTIAGLALGLAAAVAVTRVLQASLFGV